MKELGPELAKVAQQKLIEEFGQQMGWTVSQVTKEFVQEWTREHVLPEAQRLLEAQKPQLIATIVAGMHAACRQLAAALEQKAAKNAASHWRLDEMVKALLRG
jgi:hypothetical protein